MDPLQKASPQAKFSSADTALPLHIANGVTLNLPGYVAVILWRVPHDS